MLHTKEFYFSLSASLHFATIVTLTNGVQIETVYQLIGHSSISTTQIYAKVIKRKVSDDMTLLKEKLIKVK